MHFRVIPFLAAGVAVAIAAPHHRRHDGFQVDTFKHPGALHSSSDIQRIRNYVEEKKQPWLRAYEHLESMPLVQTSWQSSAHEILVRAAAGTSNLTNNYPSAYRDAHSAYGLALRWLIGGNISYADAAVRTLDAWGSTLKKIDGNEDKFLAAGLYGYQFANAAELLRDYPGWDSTNKTAFSSMLSSVFAPMNQDFLINHNGKPNFYYANWDLCNIASMMAIGIFTDNATMYNWAVDTFLHGLPDSSIVVNGALPYFSIANFTEVDTGKTLMEIQESGRDQGHATLCIALAGIIGQQGQNQDVDLYGAFGNQILNGAEYVSKYNVGQDVPFQPYTSWEGNLTVVSPKARYEVRPGFEAVFAHYNNVRHFDASWTKAFRDYVNSNNTLDIEGGGGDFGPNSGGFDAFGHGTLLYRISPE